MNKYRKFINVKWSDTGNTGDSVCSPCLYFEELRGADVAHINHFWAVDHVRQYEAVIIGGGGLLNEECAPIIQRIIATAKKVVLWGIGTNSQPGFEIPDLRAANVIGWLRHKNPNFPVGVCPSCLHPALELVPALRNAACGVLSHKDHLIDAPGLPHLTNMAPMSELVKFICSHKLIWTNTWHGAYFCYLLNTPFEIHQPWSSKFDDLDFEAFGDLDGHRERALEMKSETLEFIDRT